MSQSKGVLDITNVPECVGLSRAGRQHLECEHDALSCFKCPEMAHLEKENCSSH